MRFVALAKGEEALARRSWRVFCGCAEALVVLSADPGLARGSVSSDLSRVESRG